MKKESIAPDVEFHRVEMQKDLIVDRLKENGYRITRQRMVLLEIILQGDYTCCKEIIFAASKRQQNIGPATVYRMINVLEEIGAISRRNTYKVNLHEEQKKRKEYIVQLDDGTRIKFTEKKWNEIIAAGLKVCGYLNGQQIAAVKTY